MENEVEDERGRGRGRKEKMAKTKAGETQESEEMKREDGQLEALEEGVVVVNDEGAEG